MKRATYGGDKVLTGLGDFNPRPREEGDSRRTFQSAYQVGGISIHALVKRATANLYNDYLYFEAKYHISDIFPL